MKPSPCDSRSTSIVSTSAMPQRLSTSRVALTPVRTSTSTLTPNTCHRTSSPARRVARTPSDRPSPIVCRLSPIPASCGSSAEGRSAASSPPAPGRGSRPISRVSFRVRPSISPSAHPPRPRASRKQSYVVVGPPRMEEMFPFRASVLVPQAAAPAAVMTSCVGRPRHVFALTVRRRSRSRVQGNMKFEA